MIKYMILILLAGIALSGCRDSADSKIQSENGTPVISEAGTEPASDEGAKPIDVAQGGPYGRIALSLPDGWNYKLYPADSGDLPAGLYGIRFYPPDVADGYIEVAYSDSFGVCGTGLDSMGAALAGRPVSVGTYNGHPHWDFISFQEDYEGLVALTYSAEGWWESYSSQVWDILDTLSFDTAVREGGACVYNDESEINQIGLSFSLKNISPSGAALVFNQYDESAPSGELQYGADFLLEIEKNGIWEEASAAATGKYAFHAVAYLIEPGCVSETQLDWKWFYGALAPGNYRIKKDIMDFRGTGDFDKYTVTAYFFLN